ncbi:MAG: hypothetical protein JXR63_12335 [Spirochaetales bacterium]|nr:hypothetical protein [Spirochaetales bacterium]
MKKILLFTFLILSFTVSANPQILWEMDKHFGFDKNEDGRIDIPNTKEYVNPDGYGISLKIDDADEFRGPFSWTLTDSNGKTHISKTIFPRAYFTNIPTGQGSISCNFEQTTIQIEINPKNYLIAVIGDSYASGEGNPELQYDKSKPSIWADGGPGSLESINHLRGHRSSLAWGPQTALFLENYDPHSSITLIFLAASGATVQKGVIGEYSGVEDPFDLDPMPPQVDQLAELCDGREIDQLYISVGGNDVGFVPVATHLVVYSPSKKGIDDRYKKKIERLYDSIKRGVFDTPLGILMGKQFKPLPGLNGIADEYRKLEEELSKKVKVKEKYLLAYPCPAIPGTRLLEDFAPALGLAINGYDTEFIVNNVFKPLEVIKKEISKELNWNYVPLRLVDYQQHHMALDQPYKPEEYGKFIGNKQPRPWKEFKIFANNGKRWFRTASESVIVQGAGPDVDTPGVFSTSGTLHPNDLGHQALMHDLLFSKNLLPGFPNYKDIYDLADTRLAEQAK